MKVRRAGEMIVEVRSWRAPKCLFAPGRVAISKMAWAAAKKDEIAAATFFTGGARLIIRISPHMPARLRVDDLKRSEEGARR